MPSRSNEAVTLRPTREDDLPLLAAIQPSDYEHDPRAEVFAGLGPQQHRVRLTSRWFALDHQPD